jgi:predicted nucleotidyltransferase
VAQESSVTRLEAALTGLGADLAELGAHWALVGGLAVSVRAAPRFTRDLDVAVTVEHDRQAEALVAALVARGYRVLALVEQEAVGRLATARLTPPGEGEHGIVVDLLLASSGVEGELVAAAEPVEVWPSLTVPVARAGHLLALKVLSRDDAERPQDAVDIRALLDVVGPDDERLAVEAARLIRTRGYHRNRDIVLAVEQALASRGHNAPLP